MAGLGRHPRGREAVPAPADGGRGRLRRARRRPGRPARRRARARSATRDNTLIFYIWGDNGSSGEGQNGTISELLAQNGIPTTVDAAHRRARGARRPRRARLAEDRQPVPRRLGVGGQHALQGHEAAGVAPRRHPQPDGRALAGEGSRPTRRRARSSTTATTSCRRSTRSSASPRRASVNGVPQDPIDGVSFAYTFDDAKATGGCSPSTSRSWAAARSTTTAGWRRRSARASRGCPGLPPGHPRVEPGRRHVGALQPGRGLDPGPRPRRSRCPRSWRSCRNCS